MSSDLEYAKAYKDAEEPATEDIRKAEAEYYGLMQRYRSEFDSITEVIHYMISLMDVVGIKGINQ